MFTGLIADLGSVTALERTATGATLGSRTRLASELQRGRLGRRQRRVPDRDRRSRREASRRRRWPRRCGAPRWARCEPGARVNLELALRADDRLGGHVVQGHVDGTGTVSAVREEGFARVLRIDDRPTRAGALSGREGLGRGRRRQPDRQRAATTTGFEVSLIPETLAAHEPGGQRPSGIGSTSRWTSSPSTSSD